MNITYILGNGFDIQLGLKSRYSDFLEEYIKPKGSDTVNVSEFKKYLKNHNDCMWWSDAEVAMGEHLGEFTNETIDKYTEQMENFEDELGEYLDCEQSRCIWEDYTEIGERFIKFLETSFEDIFNNRTISVGERDRQYNFISLNYTNTIDKILECCKKVKRGDVIHKDLINNRWRDGVLGQLCHVHGDLKSQIIMGVNDESQLRVNDRLTVGDVLKWQFIKEDMSKASNHTEDRKARNLIANSDVIAIYGVSYGESDARWWSEIAKWLKGNTDHKLVAFIYEESMSYKPRVPWSRAKHEEKIRKEILGKLGINDEKIFNELKGQVYLIRNTEKLNLQELIRPEEAIAAMKETDKSEV